MVDSNKITINVLSAEKYEGIWELYGLNGNPFSTAPLLLYSSQIPITCFIGRDDELNRINKQLRSKGGSRTMVVGDVGVGKTSFVNYARYLAKSKYFSPIKEIEVQENWDSEAFIANTLFAIWNTLTIEGNLSWIEKDTLSQIESITKINRISGVGGGLTLGIGANYNQETSNPDSIPFLAIQDIFQNVINQIYDKQHKETILHYNNLENLSEKSIKRLFENLRNTFQTNHTHFIFIGNLMADGVIQSIPRVASIFSEHIRINTMSLEEVKAVIEKRLQDLKISEHVIRPYDERALNVLYKLYDGNIREILNSLNKAVSTVTNDKPILLTEDTLNLVLRQDVENRFLANLSPNAILVLKVILNAKKGEITNKGISQVTKIEAPNISKYIHTELELNSCIHLVRKSGKDKFWGVRPEIKWMLLSPVPSDIKQATMKKFV